MHQTILGCQQQTKTFTLNETKSASCFKLWIENQMQYLVEVAQRYLDLLDVGEIFHQDVTDPTSTTHLAWMLREIQKLEMSETKANRWMGYVQGCLVMQGIIHVEHERNATRNIFCGK